MDRPGWYGPALTWPRRGSVAFPQDNSNVSTAEVRAKRQLYNACTCGSLLCSLTKEPFFASSQNTSPWVREGTEMEELEKKSKMSGIGDYREMGLLTDWNITKFQYLVEIRTSFLLNSFRGKDLFRKFLSELKEIMTTSAIF